MQVPEQAATDKPITIDVIRVPAKLKDPPAALDGLRFLALQGFVRFDFGFLHVFGNVFIERGFHHGVRRRQERADVVHVPAVNRFQVAGGQVLRHVVVADFLQRNALRQPFLVLDKRPPALLRVPERPLVVRGRFREVRSTNFLAFVVDVPVPRHHRREHFLHPNPVDPFIVADHDRLDFGFPRIDRGALGTEFAVLCFRQRNGRFAGFDPLLDGRIGDRRKLLAVPERQDAGAEQQRSGCGSHGRFLGPDQPIDANFLRQQVRLEPRQPQALQREAVRNREGQHVFHERRVVQDGVPGEPLNLRRFTHIK